MQLCVSYHRFEKKPSNFIEKTRAETHVTDNDHDWVSRDQSKSRSSVVYLKKLLRNRFPPPGCSRIRRSRCEWRRRRCYRENPWRTLYRINYPPEEARSPVQLFSSNDCRDTRWDEKSYSIVALQRVFDQPTTSSTLQAFQLTYTHAHTIDSAKKGEHFDRKNSLCSRKFAFPFFFFNLILSIQLIEWSFVTILPPSSGRLIPFFFFFSFPHSPDADRWSSKLRSWQASGSHGLLANGEQRPPVEDGQDLHVPRTAETSSILHFRVRGPIPHGPDTQGHLQSQKLNDESCWQHDQLNQRNWDWDEGGEGGEGRGEGRERDRHMYVHSSFSNLS